MATAAPEAPAEHHDEGRHEEHGHGHETEAQRHLQAGAKQLVEAQRARQREQYISYLQFPPPKPISEGWKDLPALPSLETVGKAALAATTIVAPPAGLTIGAGLWGGNKLRKIPPFSWAERGVRSIGSKAFDGIKSIGSVASYPFRLGARIGANVLDMTGRTLYKGFDVTLIHFYRDMRDHLLNLPNTDLDLVTRSIVGMKNMTVEVAKHLVKIPVILAKKMAEHPIAATGATLLTLGAIANANWSVIGAAQNFATMFHELFNLLITKLGGVPKVPLPTAP